MAKFDITIERTIWCGRCPFWDQQSAPILENIIRIWKQDGWKLHKHEGDMKTVCPTCVRELRDEKEWADVGYRG